MTNMNSIRHTKAGTGGHGGKRVNNMALQGSKWSHPLAQDTLDEEQKQISGRYHAV